MIRIEDIVEKVSRNHPQADLNLLRRAYFFSARYHEGQKRASGEPYLIHPLEVAGILADLRLDEIAVATGLLHDVVEDTLVDLDMLRSHFNDEVAGIVDGLTKIAAISNISKEEQQAENVRKMVLAMVKDVRVVLVKLADRLHNMRTLDHLKPEKRQRIAQETMDIFAPIAHRLGMGKLRGELEDLSFKYLYPEDYKELAAQLEKRRPIDEKFLNEVKVEIADALRVAEVPFIEVQGRIKRHYSIWKKLKKQKIGIEQVYDLIAARIILPGTGKNEQMQCYGALGVVHQHWRSIPERFRDWISNPRENGYRSLHTSVAGPKGHPFEVQIRTEEMHRVAEEGVAAHWKYKEGRGGSPEDEEVLQRLRSLVEWTQEVNDSRELLETLKVDLYPKDVYAFTPMGRVIQLPRGATPVDFAYSVHTEVGNKCTGAKINGRMVQLRARIQNGDMVEILTSANSHPSRDWLNFVVTSRARNRVRHWVADQQRAESVEMGRKMLEREAERFRLSIRKMLRDADGGLKRVANDYGYGRVEDLLAAIGYGKVVPRNVIAKYLGPDKFAELDKQEESKLRAGVKAVKRMMRLGEDGIVVRGVDDLMVSRARCCNPVRGEAIIGYITRGKGVAVHSKRCTNAQQLMINPERVIIVEWAGKGEKEAFGVRLLAMTENRTGMLAGITGAISDMKAGIRDARATTVDDRGRIEVTVEVFDVKHLDRVVNSIKGVTGVIEVERLNAA